MKQGKCIIHLKASSWELSLTRDCPTGKLRDAFADVYRWIENTSSDSAFLLNTSGESTEYIVLRSAVSYIHICFEGE